jgi:uncharacterized damage-inducible protein DinB
MMPNITQPHINPAPGFKCSDAATFFTQMEDQTRRLLAAIADITPAELEWQSAPGMNTIGMLLAHLAGAEAGWALRGLEGVQASDLDAFIAKCEELGFPDDGIPLSADGVPPAYLMGKDLAFFEDRLARGRAYWRNAAAKITCADMNREITETIWDGSQRVYTPRWVMYHILVHFPGHAGQIYLLRHLYRDRK